MYSPIYGGSIFAWQLIDPHVPLRDLRSWSELLHTGKVLAFKYPGLYLWVWVPKHGALIRSALWLRGHLHTCWPSPLWHHWWGHRHSDVLPVGHSSGVPMWPDNVWWSFSTGVSLEKAQPCSVHRGCWLPSPRAPCGPPGSSWVMSCDRVGHMWSLSPRQMACLFLIMDFVWWGKFGHGTLGVACLCWDWLRQVGDGEST